MPRTASFSLQARDGINKCERLQRVVPIGRGELDGQRDSPAVANQVALAAELGPVRRLGAGQLPPKTARIEQLCNTALDQSIRE